MRKRLVNILPSLAGGGAEKVCISIAEGLSNNYDSFVVLLSKKGDNQKLLHTNSKIYYCSENIILRYVRLIFIMIYIRPHYTISHLSKTNEIIAVIFGLFTNVVIVEHNNFWKNYGNISVSKKIFLRILYKYMCKQVFVSEGMRDSYQAGIGRELVQSKVIYNPVLPMTTSTQAGGVCTTKPFILGIGALTEQKNFRELIQIFSKIKKNNSDLKLIILGTGPKLQELKKCAKELRVSNDVVFPGYCSNVIEYLIVCQCFVLTSSWEGLPTVLIEAMTTGSQVLAADCNYGPREILTKKDAWRLYPPGNVERAAHLLERILEQGPKTVDYDGLERFEKSSIYSEYSDMLRTIN